MYKLLIFTVVGICTLLVAKCNGEFEEEFKAFIDNGFCKTDDEKSKEKVLKCIDMFPDKMKQIAKEDTGIDNMREILEAICAEKEKVQQVADVIEEYKENNEEINTDEEYKEKVRACMKQ